MAVEALRQLGGMCNIVPEPDVSTLSCTVCGEDFPSTNDLHDHIAICSEKNNTFTCSNCHELFDNNRDFNSHPCFLQDILPCKFCNENFFSKSDLETHINKVHQCDRPFRCQVCNLTFLRNSSLKNHLKIHNYIPGRALFNIISGNKVQEEPAEIETLKWPNHQLVYIHNNENLLNTYNYDAATCLVQTELDADVNLAPKQELLLNTTYEDTLNHSNIGSSAEMDKSIYNSYQNDSNYSTCVKVENVSFLPEIEKIDETFPVSNMSHIESANDSNKKSHPCIHCGVTFAREKALSSHLKCHGWCNKHECESCGETFETEQLKFKHQENCLLNNTLFSTISDKSKIQNEQVAKNSTEPKKINKPYLKIGKHACPECQKKFATKQKVFRHMWIHRKKIFRCEMCGSTFDAQLDLDKHRLKKHHNDSPYVCQECGKSFASRQGLWEHSRIHNPGNTGLLHCDICSKTFASRQGYLIHNRTHTGERPYGCRFCMKSFRDGGTLRKHERIHTGERPHVCPICSHDFNQKVVLREHVRWVHVANKKENQNGLYECQICNFNIKDKDELVAHIVRHSDHSTAQMNNSVKVEPQKTAFKIGKNKVVKTENNNKNIRTHFRCTLCGGLFSQQRDLQIHIRIHI